MVDRHASHRGFLLDENDEDLIARYAKGETDALSVLFERYRRPLYGFVARMSPSAADADEVFQEVWLRVINKAKTYRKDRFRGWLYRIAHNLMIDRSRCRKPNVSLDAATGDEGTETLVDRVPSKGRSPSDAAEGAELRASIQSAVARLPPEQREVFLLRTEGDVPFKEIAQMQGVSINTALARMQYAISRLRKLLHEEGKAMENLS